MRSGLFILFLSMCFVILVGCSSNVESQENPELNEDTTIEESVELEEQSIEEELPEGQFDWSDKEENPELNVGGYSNSFYTEIPETYDLLIAADSDEISEMWQDATWVTEYKNSSVRLNYGEVVTFTGLSVQVEDIYFERINESDIEYSLVIDANYINIENYPFDINDIFVPIANGIEFEQLEILTEGHESSVLEPATESRIKLVSKSPADYSFRNLDNIEYEAVRVETPYYDEGYAMYHSSLE